MRQRLRSAPVLVCFGLVALTWIVFGQTIHFPFVNFDDPEYVYEVPEINAGLTLHGIVWAFTHLPSPNWYPLTNISHMIEFQCYGLDAGGYHLTNVILHALAAVLLFLALSRMTGALWPSAFVAAVFVIHPLRVESVAWVIERKDVLSGVFFMLTLVSYACYIRQRSIARYLLVSLCFVGGLMSKPMLLTTPFVLLVLDYWPLQRIVDLSSLRGRILEKLPLLVLSILSATLTYFGQAPSHTATQQLLPFSWRLANSIVSYATYIWEMIWPVNLAVYYPHPGSNLPIGLVLAAALLLLAVTLLAWLYRNKAPYLLAGWLWYISILAPVIGLVQINRQAHADRYTYLAHIGLYLMVAWPAYHFVATRALARRALTAIAAMIIAALTFVARVQASYWRDSETLWQHAIDVTSNNDTAHAYLADIYLRRGQLEDAIAQCQEALRIQPSNADAQNNLGVAEFLSGRLSEAISHWQRALQIEPNNMNAQGNLAWTLATSPDSSLRDGATALALAQRLVDHAGHPNAMILRTLAAAYAENGQFSEAIATAESALQLANAQKNSALAADLQLNIANYKRGLPLRDPGSRIQ